MQLDANGNNRTLGELIFREITGSSSHRITFEKFMEWVLYHPQQGYYAIAPSKIGATGDFFTAPHLAADFGELLAIQFLQMWQILGQPDRFTLVEMGAGQGLLAKDVLAYLQSHNSNVLAHLEYLIVERSPALIQEQRQQLQPFVEAGVRLEWRSLEELATESITGCCFSNELVDALPVHQVVVQSGQLKEIYVTLDLAQRPPQFAEVIDEPSTPDLFNYFDLIGLDITSSRYPDGYRTEVNLAALDWMTSVANCLKQGYVLTIDYGYPADRYYNPVRSQGTLQCYYRHRYHSDPYLYLGQQDITAHVNFTALEKQGERCGLQTIGFTKQGLFLMALGLGERIAAIGQSNAIDAPSIQTALRRREALHTLIDPMRLGSFGVLIQGKGVNRNEQLIGLRGELELE